MKPLFHRSIGLRESHRAGRIGAVLDFRGLAEWLAALGRIHSDPRNRRRVRRWWHSNAITIIIVSVMMILAWMVVAR
ncbi:MAG TPA: hypothetical protein VKT27_16630 [Candidatus Binataceae bacterium]|nr:hypothetical protein [Candidatus Binataceae bacterium]